MPAETLAIPRRRRRRRPPRWFILLALWYVLTLAWIALSVIATLKGDVLWIVLGLVWIWLSVQARRHLMRAKAAVMNDRPVPAELAGLAQRLIPSIVLNFAFIALVTWQMATGH